SLICLVTLTRFTSCPVATRTVGDVIVGVEILRSMVIPVSLVLVTIGAGSFHSDEPLEPRNLLSASVTAGEVLYRGGGEFGLSILRGATSVGYMLAGSVVCCMLYCGLKGRYCVAMWGRGL